MKAPPGLQVRPRGSLQHGATFNPARETPMDRTETRIGRIELDPLVFRDRARELRSDFLLGLARRLASRLRPRSPCSRPDSALLGA